MTHLQLLLSARSLLLRGHCTGNMARDIRGKVVNCHSSSAHTFCLLGALDRANNSHTNGYNSLEPIEKALSNHLVYINDTLGHEAAIAALDYLIENTFAEQQ